LTLTALEARVALPVPHLISSSSGDMYLDVGHSPVAEAQHVAVYLCTLWPRVRLRYSDYCMGEGIHAQTWSNVKAMIEVAQCHHALQTERRAVEARTGPPTSMQAAIERLLEVDKHGDPWASAGSRFKSVAI